MPGGHPPGVLRHTGCPADRRSSACSLHLSCGNHAINSTRPTCRFLFQRQIILLCNKDSTTGRKIKGSVYRIHRSCSGAGGRTTRPLPTNRQEINEAVRPLQGRRTACQTIILYQEITKGIRAAHRQPQPNRLHRPRWDPWHASTNSWSSHIRDQGCWRYEQTSVQPKHRRYR